MLRGRDEKTFSAQLFTGMTPVRATPLGLSDPGRVGKIVAAEPAWRRTMAVVNHVLTEEAHSEVFSATSCYFSTLGNGVTVAQQTLDLLV